MRHGSVIRPTMYLASMDTETAFDVARPKHIAKIMGDHDVHGWIVAASLREMAGLEGQGKFESVESTVSVLKIATQILGNVEPEWVKKKWACPGNPRRTTSTRTGEYIVLFKIFFKKIQEYTFNQAGRTLDCMEERMQKCRQSLVERCEDSQKQRRADESEVQENGGARLCCILLWKRKLVLESSHLGQELHRKQRP